MNKFQKKIANWCLNKSKLKQGGKSALVMARKWMILLDIRVSQEIRNSEKSSENLQNWNRANNEYDIKESSASTTACLLFVSSFKTDSCLWRAVHEFGLFLEVFSCRYSGSELTPHWESVDSMNCHHKSDAIATMI